MKSISLTLYVILQSSRSFRCIMQSASSERGSIALCTEKWPRIYNYGTVDSKDLKLDKLYQVSHPCSITRSSRIQHRIIGNFQIQIYFWTEKNIVKYLNQRKCVFVICKTVLWNSRWGRWPMRCVRNSSSAAESLLKMTMCKLKHEGDVSNIGPLRIGFRFWVIEDRFNWSNSKPMGSKISRLKHNSDH